MIGILLGSALVRSNLGALLHLIEDCLPSNKISDKEGPTLFSDHHLSGFFWGGGGNFCKGHAALFEAHYLFNDLIGYQLPFLGPTGHNGTHIRQGLLLLAQIVNQGCVGLDGATVLQSPKCGTSLGWAWSWGSIYWLLGKPPSAVPVTHTTWPPCSLSCVGYRQGPWQLHSLDQQPDVGVAPGTAPKQYQSYLHVNSLPPLALDCKIFTRRTKKGPKMPARPLHSLEDLAHTVDERFVLAYPADSLPLVAPSCEETLINLDYLLAWVTKSKAATSMLDNSVEFQMPGTPPSQSGGSAEISLKPSSPPGPIQQNFSSSQSGGSAEISLKPSSLPGPIQKNFSSSQSNLVPAVM
ncbi:hypothetical protein DSO57_1030306 [Entomophthora muscae]|uniref:Uncharacterized protein n=1 Tax=Entomophthora muscae TaxID=34485 RepID=A0ACC2TBW0_9FUNG|nr:hypothetical protein DSO57_1030306 [Entomophthora muscae]